MYDAREALAKGVELGGAAVARGDSNPPCFEANKRARVVLAGQLPLFNDSMNLQRGVDTVSVDQDGPTLRCENALTSVKTPSRTESLTASYLCLPVCVSEAGGVIRVFLHAAPQRRRKTANSRRLQGWANRCVAEGLLNDSHPRHKHLAFMFVGPDGLHSLLDLPQQRIRVLRD